MTGAKRAMRGSTPSFSTSGGATSSAPSTGPSAAGPLVLVPPRDHVAGEAMRDQDDRAPGPVDRQVELVDPGVAVRIVPLAELDARGMRQLALPRGLPVLGAAVVEAGDDQHERFGVRAKGNF